MGGAGGAAGGKAARAGAGKAGEKMAEPAHPRTLVENVRKLHGLQLLLQQHDVALQLDLELLVVLQVCGLRGVQLRGVALLARQAVLHVALLHGAPRVQQRVQLAPVRCKQLLALAQEGRLHLPQLRASGVAVLQELRAHAPRQHVQAGALRVQQHGKGLVLARSLGIEVRHQGRLARQHARARAALLLQRRRQLLGQLAQLEVVPAHHDGGAGLASARRLISQVHRLLRQARSLPCAVRHLIRLRVRQHVANAAPRAQLEGEQERREGAGGREGEGALAQTGRESGRGGKGRDARAGHPALQQRQPPAAQRAPLQQRQQRRRQGRCL